MMRKGKQPILHYPWGTEEEAKGLFKIRYISNLKDS